MTQASHLALAVLEKVGAAEAPIGIGVAALLTDSRAAHINFRDAVRNKHEADAQNAMIDAAVKRAQAELLDPDHTAPSWSDEGGTHARGSASHEALHLDLLQFYLQLLTR